MTTAELVVEIGFAGPDTGTVLHLDDAVRGLLNTGTLGADDVFVAVSTTVQAVSTRRGATRVDGPNVRYEAGSATLVLLDPDRSLDPTNLDGPYVVAGETQVVPMRPVRLRAVWDGTAYNVWRGFIDDIKIEYRAEADAVVTLTCFDAFSVFSHYDRNASGAAGAGESSGDRIGRVLDSVAWGELDRVIADGLTTVQATTLAANAMTELYLTSDTEIGELYVDGAGRVVFRDRHAILTEARSNTSQVTFGDGGGAELPYASVTVDYGRGSIYNHISIACDGGAAQVADDAASIEKYLTRTYTRTDLIHETDEESLSHALFLLGQAAEPELRFSELSIQPRRDADAGGLLFGQALGRELGDRVTVIRRPPGGGDPIERDVFVRGVSHSIRDAGLVWTTTFVLQSATRFGYFVLDSATLGVLDTDRLAF